MTRRNANALLPLGEPAPLPLELLVGALMICGYGANLQKRLAKPGERAALLVAAAEGAAEAMARLAARGLTAVHGRGVGPPILLIRSASPWAALPPPRSVIAVVGARAADPYGLALARTFSETLARAGLTVVSGGAEGCDAAAHEGALFAGDPETPPTIAVTPGGLDRPYPNVHKDLFRRIIDRGGALVSADWPTASLRKHSFIDRNQVIAAISGGVIVVRARVRSGSLSTARAAERLQRPVGAVPGNVGVLLSEGCHVLLEDGATPIATATGLARFLVRVDPSRPLERVGRAWPQSATPQPAPWPQGPTHEIGDDSRGSEAYEPSKHPEIMTIIKETPGIDLDSLAARTNLAAPTLAGALMELEISGRVARGPGGRYMATD